MNIRFEKRDTFYVSGFSMETNEANLERDVALLRERYEDKLRVISSCLYFAAWTGKDDEMVYHFSVETSGETPEGTTTVEVPSGYFAVASVPKGTPILPAWHEFFASLPSTGAEINQEYSIYLEYFNQNGDCELWIPIVEK